VLAQREFTKDEYADWERRYHDAETAEEGRDKLKEDLHAEVEINLRLIGATAIEDKLQDGVPETIQMIKVRSVCPFRQLFASSLTWHNSESRIAGRRDQTLGVDRGQETNRHQYWVLMQAAEQDHHEAATHN
jgi:hypothetical protein